MRSRCLLQILASPISWVLLVPASAGTTDALGIEAANSHPTTQRTGFFEFSNDEFRAMLKPACDKMDQKLKSDVLVCCCGGGTLFLVLVVLVGLVLLLWGPHPWKR